MIKEELEDLFQQKMTRGQFLQYIGSALLLAFGAGSVIKALRFGVKKPTVQSEGYGSSVYGGRSVNKN